MAWYSAFALYLLFWVFTFFLVLPFGVRTTEEEGGDLVPGQAPSAPHRAGLGKKALWTTAISGVLFAIFMLNWQMGWFTQAEFFAAMP